MTSDHTAKKNEFGITSREFQALMGSAHRRFVMGKFYRLRSCALGDCDSSLMEELNANSREELMQTLLDEFPTFGYPVPVVHDIFCGGYLISLLRHRCADHGDWPEILSAIGVTPETIDATVAKAQGMLKQHPETADAIEVAIAQCGGEFFDPEECGIVDEPIATTPR